MVDFKNIINDVYRTLFNTYSSQGQWPVGSYVPKQKVYDVDNSFSPQELERFEIIMGTILTQNTTWTSVEKAFNNLSNYTDFNPFNILEFIESDIDLFKKQIKPARYYNQKAIYLQNIAEFFISLDGAIPSRKDVLTVKGVGNETADSIMLYAYNQKEFVVDAYTKRIFSYLGLFDMKVSYKFVKELFENNFDGSVEEYKQYHALIVNHAKLYYKKKPYGVNDKVLNEYKI